MSGTRVVQRLNELAIGLIKSVPRPGSDPDVIRGDTGDVARTMALLNVAVFDAVNGVYVREGHDDFEALVVDDEPPNSANAAVAGAVAGTTVLRGLFSDRDRRQSIEDELESLLASIGASPAQRRDGIVWGRCVAGEVLVGRLNDVPVPGQDVPTRDGGFNRSWRSQYAEMRPFVMGGPGEFRPPPPPPPNSQRYASALEEAHQLGERVTTARTTDQTAAARAWNGGARTSRPSGAWFEAAVHLADSQELDLREASRLFGLLGVTICDCMISSWDAKRTYDFWRPQDAIRNAHLDGNSRTERNLSWLQLSGSIGGSPEYTSGTATFAGGASHLLRTYFGTDDVEFSLDLQRDLRPGEVPADQRGERAYNSFTEAADEAGMSRIYNGIHYQFSSDAGMEAGRQIAERALSLHRPRAA